MKHSRCYFSVILCLLLGLGCLLFSTTASAAPKRVRVNIKNLTIAKGQNYTLRLYNLKKNYKTTFTSSNSDIATVSSKRIKSKKATVTAVESGTTTIQIVVRTNKKIITQITCNVTVTPTPISIKFARKKVSLGENSYMNLRVIIKPNTSLANAVFESSDATIVSVNSKGRIFAYRNGTAKVTATLPSGQKAVCTIIVTDRPPEEHKPKAPAVYQIGNRPASEAMNLQVLDNSME